MTEEELHRGQFGDDFQWGVSTAAFQIEGSCDADGKGRSIWDSFTASGGKILDRHHAKVACDFYKEYERDIDLVKRLHIPNFRFSISWPRILPEGVGRVNQKGIDFYNGVIDRCLAQGIEPWVTLYHWDLPQALEDRGGWTNRAVIGWFSEYVALCAKHFGDRVKHWMVMNEPVVFTGAGYFLGKHAPGRKGLKNFLPAVHHVALSMAEGGRVLRTLLPHAEIGTTFSCSPLHPFSDKQRDVVALRKADALMNRLFIEPVLGMGYPVDDLPVLKKLYRYFQEGDEAKLAFDFDFVGLQNYTREIIRSSFFTPYIGASIVSAKDRKVPLTEMNWEVYPDSIYESIKKYNSYAQIKKIYITENGAAFADQVIEGQVHDPQRVDYLKCYIEQVLRAKQEGMKIDGYFIWTLTDNFEWAEGYHPRFGIVHVDFDTQERIVKSSGKWYARFLGSEPL